MNEITKIYKLYSLVYSFETTISTANKKWNRFMKEVNKCYEPVVVIISIARYPSLENIYAFNIAKKLFVSNSFNVNVI